MFSWHQGGFFWLSRSRAWPSRKPALAINGRHHQDVQDRPIIFVLL